MTVLAWITVVSFGCAFVLPGSIYKKGRKPSRSDFDWGGTHIYFSLAMTFGALALAVWTLVA